MQYIKNIIDNPDYIIEDNRHKDTLIYLKHIHSIEKSRRVVIKLALVQDNEHKKNSIITLMKLNKRTWNQTIRNRGKIIWKNNRKDYLEKQIIWTKMNKSSIIKI